MDERWVQEVCWLNTEFLTGKPRAVALSFPGLGGGCRDGSGSAVEIALGAAGILVVHPYYGPWSWMNRQARAFVDLLVERIYEQFDLAESVPLISSGASMGGGAALLYCRYGKKTPCRCCATYPVCDAVYHFSERPDLPASFRHAFLGYPEPLEELLREHSPLHQARWMPDIPFLLIHGDADQAVAKTAHTDRMAAELRRLGRSVEYMEVPKMGHGVNVPLTVAQRTVEFIVAAVE